MMMTAVTGVTLATAHAQAADGVGVNTSTGSVALHFEQNKGIPTSIETGFLGPSFAKINVGISIDPVKNGGPLYVIDMPKGAQVLASWGTDKQILLKAQNGAQTDGLVDVHHTLAPKVDFKFSGFGLNATFSYDATSLVNKIPGAQFAYDAKSSQHFAPWGFTGADTKVAAPSDLDNSTLFSMNMNVLPDFVSNNVTGSFGVAATTDSTFTYKTTKIALSGVGTPITPGASEITVPAVDGDYMELMTAVEGEMTVKGTLNIRPFVHVDTILDEYNLNADFGINAMKFDFTVPAQKVNYQTVIVHIPMPNVRVPSTGVDIGTTSSGGSKSKTVTIENTGEKEALMKFKSSDPQFSVPGDTVTVPAKSKYDLKITFSPNSASAAQADITVLSSDADSPEQTFKVGANGANVGDSSADDDEDGTAPSADSGCGCKTAGSSSTIPSWAGLGLAGLGAAVLFRRRRTH
jgi:MYXO-CTERM domain-containing protein